MINQILSNFHQINLFLLAFIVSIHIFVFTPINHIVCLTSHRFNQGQLCTNATKIARGVFENNFTDIYTYGFTNNEVLHLIDVNHLIQITQYVFVFLLLIYLISFNFVARLNLNLTLKTRYFPSLFCCSSSS